MKTLGIDVSAVGGSSYVKTAKAAFAIIRTGFGFGDEDTELASNIKNCALPYGFYHFSYAYDVKTAEREADFVLSLLKKYKAKPTLPIFFDWEYHSDEYLKGKGIVVDKAIYTLTAKAFMDRIRKSGFKSGNYYNIDYRNRFVGKEILDRKKYFQWVAFYGDGQPINGEPKGTPPDNCDIWQYTEKGTIKGFKGDLNLMVNTTMLQSKKPTQPKPKPTPVPKPTPKPAPNINPKSRIFLDGANEITNPYGGNHTGTDVVNSTRPDDIIAHTDGEVIWCQTGYGNNTYSSGNASYGNAVKITCTGGYSVLYAHLASVRVQLGDRVTRGQNIGLMGNTGNSNRKHLHFEIFDRYGDRVNPEQYLNSDLPGGAATRPPQTVTYKTGSYKVNTDVLTVRKGSSTDFDYVPYRNLTENAKAQIKKLSSGAPNGYVKNMVCDVSEIKGNWGKTPSGWICLEYCIKI